MGGVLCCQSSRESNAAPSLGAWGAWAPGGAGTVELFAQCAPRNVRVLACSGDRHPDEREREDGHQGPQAKRSGAVDQKPRGGGS